MSLFNKIFIKGNVTDKPELSYTPKGTAVARFIIGVNETYKDDKGTEVKKAAFYQVQTWKKQAEKCAEKLVKGQEVIIEGRLSFDSWKDKESGAPHSKVYITATIVYFGRLPKPKPADQAQGTPSPEGQAQEEQPTDEEIPF